MGSPASGEPVQPPRPVRWGLGDAALGLLVGLALTFFLGVVLVAARGYTDASEISIGDMAILQLGLWVGLLGVPLLAVRLKGNGAVVDLGIRQRWYDAPLGLVIGVACQVVLVPLIYLPLLPFIDEEAVREPAEELASRAQETPGGVALLVLLVVVGAPIAEEVFFRGLLQRATQRRFGPVWAVIVSALVFAAFHFQVVQFPALAAFGFVAALIAQRTGRLGGAIWAHVGFNATTVVLLLALEGST